MIFSQSLKVRCGNAESILQLDPPTNAAIGPSRALRRAPTSKNPTTCTLPSDVISHDLIHLVLKSVTLNDLERCNGRYIALFH